MTATVVLTVRELQALLSAAREAEVGQDELLHLRVETEGYLPRLVLGRAEVAGEDILADIECVG